MQNVHNLEPHNKAKAVTSNQLLAEVWVSLNLIEKDLIWKRVKPGGRRHLWVMDQHLDFFCRLFFPLAYIIVLIVMFAKIPAQPTMSAFLKNACTDQGNK